jgi:hypothetical protein
MAAGPVSAWNLIEAPTHPKYIVNKQPHPVYTWEHRQLLHLYKINNHPRTVPVVFQSVKNGRLQPLTMGDRARPWTLMGSP